MTKTPPKQATRRDQWNAGAPRDVGHSFLSAHGAALATLRPITERDYVMRGLDLANWDGEDIKAFERIEERLLVGGDWPDGVRVLQPNHENGVGCARGRFYRDLLIRALSEVFGGLPRVRIDQVDRSVKGPLTRPWPDPSAYDQPDYRQRLGGQVATIIVASSDGDHLELGHVYRPGTTFAAIDLVMWFLTAADRPFRAEFRQCAWEQCFNFFLAEKPKAGPRRRYCGKTCMEAAHRAGTPDRKAAAKRNMTTKRYRALKATKKARK